MRPGIFWGDLGYPGVSWGNQTDPLNLVQVIAFTKISFFFFKVTSICNLLALTNKKLRYICFFVFAVFWCLPELKR